MHVTRLDGWNCSVAKTLAVVGEWWTPLILRDAFRGTRRFDDFQASLGMARSVLTTRLRKLSDEGILERRRYSDHPPRYEYWLTEKGRALFPLIVALMHWGDTWVPGPAGPPAVLIHDTCGNITQPVLTCPRCHSEVGPGNTHSERGPGSATSQAASAARAPVTESPGPLGHRGVRGVAPPASRLSL